MKPVAYIYTCRNPGQTSLLWAHQPPPFGHGWIDVKRVGLVREDEVSEVIRNGEKCVAEFAAYESALSSLLPGVYYMDPPDGGAVTLVEQIRRMAQDAARYRWLRANQLDGLEIIEKFVGEQMEYVTDEELDAAIDSELLK